MSASPLTVLLGPQTSLSLTLNELIRSHRPAMVRAGLNALPSRLASPIFRRAVNLRPVSERKAELATAVEQRPAFFAAVNFFGPPPAGITGREMFPEAEAVLARLSEVVDDLRVVLSVDTLPTFFLAAGSEPLEMRVQKTPWESLYELSWADLAREVVAALPQAEILVLTPSAGARTNTAELLFGSAAYALPEHALLRGLVTETGRAVLDRMQSEGETKDTVLFELYQSFNNLPSQQTIADRLGIDKVTQSLLEQRFAEDVQQMCGISGLSVIS